MSLKVLGYAVQHEHYDPNELLEQAVLAERHGFESIWTSDHFHPVVHTHGGGGFAWVWIAAAAERTRKVTIGTGVTTPTFRYNPAIVAQAFATLGVMYPGRIFLGVGTGEAMNEIPVGCPWPSFKERAERLEEAIKVIKLLWTKDFVGFNGRYYKLEGANLYTKPEQTTPLVVASSGPTVAEIAGKYADIFATATSSIEKCKNILFPAVQRGAKLAGRRFTSIDKAIELIVSYDEDFDTALASCRWVACSLVSDFFRIYDPRSLESLGKSVGEKELVKNFIIATDTDDHISRIERYIKAGFSHIYINNSSPPGTRFFHVYGKKVLPYLKSEYKRNIAEE